MYKIFDFQNLIIKRPVMITSVLTSDTMHNTSLDLNPNPDPNLVYPNLEARGATLTSRSWAWPG